MKKIFIVLIVILVLGVGWYLVSPLFLNSKVDEPFPVPSDEKLAQMSDSELESIKDKLMETMANGPDEKMNEMMPYSREIPLVLAEGAFEGADEFHQGSGMATIFELADSSHFLRLEDFRVTNGPDLRVLLSTDKTITEDNYIELNTLKGNVGNQNYILPPDLDISVYDTVVIYCKPFHIVFATADLTIF